jgi:hypothetical protein
LIWRGFRKSVWDKIEHDMGTVVAPCEKTALEAFKERSAEGHVTEENTRVEEERRP